MTQMSSAQQQKSIPNETSVVVTGACGLLGHHLCLTLKKQGHEVIGVDNLCTGNANNIGLLEKNNVRFVKADCCEPWASWMPKIEKPLKWVLHFASPASPPHYQRLAFETIAVNTQGLIHAMNFADSHRARVVFASTSEIYGDSLEHPQKESYWGNVNTLGPRACYDESKRLGETLVYTHNWKKNTRHGLVRIFNTYGPGMNLEDGRVIINFLIQALKDQPITIYGSGHQTRSFCYVDDLVDGILRYAASELVDAVNIGNDKEFTLLELFEVVQSILPEKKLKIEHRPLPQDDPQKRRPDIRLAREKLKWSPQTPLKEGLLATIAWLKTVL